MTQPVRAQDSGQQDEIDRRWFHWEGGVTAHYRDGALSQLRALGGDYTLRRFLFAYGLAHSRLRGADDATWFVQHMPSDGPAVYFCDEHVGDVDQFIAQLKGDEHPHYTTEQLREVAAACLAQSKALIGLAQAITSGEFKFPPQEELAK